MPKVTVRKCPKTGKVFFGDDEYAEHIIALRADLNAQRVWKRARGIVRERVWYAIENITSPAVLAEYIKKHLHDIMIAHNGANPGVAEAIKEMKLESFEFENLTYRDLCSNTHNAPRDGVTNWGSEEGKPNGYPGMYGRIKYTLKNEPKFNDPRLKVPGSGNVIDVDFTRSLKAIGIRTGGGSGITGGRHSYEVTLFLSDFRSMKKAYFHAKLEDRDFLDT